MVRMDAAEHRQFRQCAYGFLTGTDINTLGFASEPARRPVCAA